MDDFSDDGGSSGKGELAGDVIKASELIAKMSEDLSFVIDNQARAESDLRAYHAEIQGSTKRVIAYNHAYYGMVIVLLLANLMCLVWLVLP